MGRYREDEEIPISLIRKIDKTRATESKRINPWTTPRIRQSEILKWNEHSVEFQRLNNGIIYFIDIPKNELPIRLNIVGHGNRHHNTYSTLDFRLFHLKPQDLFDCIRTLIYVYNINSIRLCCCHLGKTGFAQEFANITNKPVKAYTGPLHTIGEFTKKEFKTNRSIIVKDYNKKIPVDNNPRHDINIYERQFVWFYPKNNK
ncbi:hypothetical protein Xmau_02288 [Xenorhabdus mauleonii]|uniref:Uncharacterized protein n=1 Tax=Xenorhabdus mauleonii TaxID=351675 RepID=A0A1I3Q3N8_9GAMM|nr:hypothetical protein [Xenorhabdus mauleonii]PHM40102.1 hypothetical protein Xmau_02288 [Xenorhabdus mauleonii]SFJ28212.1 hypothetical protein SAMN05421680_10720 [Xenorhabdus mauleonii]